MKMITKRGYDLGEVASAMQKAIRRADTRLAGYWALELWHSGFGPYVWRRLLILIRFQDDTMRGMGSACHEHHTSILWPCSARKPPRTPPPP